MHIHSINLERGEKEVTLSARVAWEDREQPVREIFFKILSENPDLFGELQLSSDPFLVGCFVPALRHGERRIKVDGPISPWLKDNLVTLEKYLTTWYWRRYRRPRDDSRVMLIESDGYTRRTGGSSARTACFLSGGVDSLYTLWRNKKLIPLSHSGSIKDVVFVHGFDMGGTLAGGTREELFESYAARIRSFAEQVGVKVILASTNLRHLDSNVQCWLEEFQGAAMSAVAHTLSGRISDILVASSYDIPHLAPFGSHPLIEPRCSSFNLRIHHDSERTTRADKVMAIATWPEALAVLRVCFGGDTENLNCGECDKCVRTMLELLCAGKLTEAGTFGADDVTVQMIDSFMSVREDTIYLAEELIKRTRKAGREDLSKAIRRKVLYFRLRQAFRIKRIIDKLDRNRYFSPLIDILYSNKDSLNSFRRRVRRD